MKILVIDIETTGFTAKVGEIVEVGIVELDLETGSKEIIYDKVWMPNAPTSKLSKSWIVQNDYMSIQDLVHGEDPDKELVEVQKIINRYPDGVTAFNRKFDVNFLKAYGINFTRLLPCPMLKATNICKIEKKGKYGGFKYPKVEEAYKFFYPDSQYQELHRGADDAFHEADIVMALHRLGKFLD